MDMDPLLAVLPGHLPRPWPLESPQHPLRPPIAPATRPAPQPAATPLDPTHRGLQNRLARPLVHPALDGLKVHFSNHAASGLGGFPPTRRTQAPRSAGHLLFIVVRGHNGHHVSRVAPRATGVSIRGGLFASHSIGGPAVLALTQWNPGQWQRQSQSVMSDLRNST